MKQENSTWRERLSYDEGYKEGVAVGVFCSIVVAISVISLIIFFEL